MNSLTPYTIYVEGDNDVNILKRWFPHLPFLKAGGKDRVRKEVKPQSKNWGILDRDFADDTIVEASRQPANRLVLLKRYCIENYLMEPALIAAVANSFSSTAPELTKWADEETIERQLITWADELALYAAANALIAQWHEVIEDDFLKYWTDLPPVSRETVIKALRTRLQRVPRLPRSEEIEEKLNTQHAQIVQDIKTWDGLHRWINGKVLLEKYLLPQVFAQVRGFSKDRLRDELIKAGESSIPTELVQLAQQCMVLP